MLYGNMDPVARQFAALEEADGKVRIRYHLTADKDDVAEKELSYREYQRWLNASRENGFTLERVESIRGRS